MSMTRRTALPPIGALRECLRYDADSGAIHWIDRPRSHFASDLTHVRYHKLIAGTRAECLLPHGYQVVRITHQGRRLWAMASWVAWALVHGEWPAGELDHENRCKTDNRIGNLRLATPAQNQWNKVRRPGASGLQGAVRRAGKFEATICVNGVRRNLGRFAAADEAHAAYVAASIKLHGPFAQFRSTVRTGSGTEEGGA